MRVRLRPRLSDAELAELYAKPYDHTRWPQHVERIAALAELARTVRPVPQSIADLSCGDGALGRLLAHWARGHHDEVELIHGDLVPGWPIVGPIEQTLDEIGRVDLFVLSETVEHLDDPEKVLRRIGEHADRLLLSTPDGEMDPALNREHYWGWDVEGMRELLIGAGWTPLRVRGFRPTEHSVYTFQSWLCGWWPPERVTGVYTRDADPVRNPDRDHR